MIENINVGSVPNDNTGDTLRDAFIIVNDNFADIQNQIDNIVISVVVGIEDVTGLQAALDNLQSQIDAIEAESISISDVTGLQAALDSLQNQIDSLTTNINAEFAEIDSELSAINSSITAINNAIIAINNAIANLNAIDEAPLDGNQYGRQNGEWTLIQTATIDSITFSNDFQLSGQTLTIFSGWTWNIDGVSYTNPADVDIFIPYSSSGTTRIDLIVANTSNTFVRVPGVESEDNPAAPDLPDNTLEATFVNVMDGSIDEPPTTITSDLYLEKIDQRITVINTNGIITNLAVNGNGNYSFRGNTLTEIRGFTYSNQSNVNKIFTGKEFKLTNLKPSQTPIIFRHNHASATRKLRLIGDVDYSLNYGEAIEFILDESNNFRQIGVARVSGGTQNLDEVLTEGNSTSQSIIITDNNDFTNTYAVDFTEIDLTDGDNNLYKYVDATSSTESYSDNSTGEFVNISMSPNQMLLRHKKGGPTDRADIEFDTDNNIDIRTANGEITIQAPIGLDNGFVKISATNVGINSAGGAYAYLDASNVGSDQVFQFPTSGGTFALTSQLTSLAPVMTVINHTSASHLNLSANTEKRITVVINNAFNTDITLPLLSPNSLMTGTELTVINMNTANDANLLSGITNGIWRNGFAFANDSVVSARTRSYIFNGTIWILIAETS